MAARRYTRLQWLRRGHRGTETRTFLLVGLSPFLSLSRISETLRVCASVKKREKEEL